MTKSKRTKERKTALVLSGGGSRGAYQIGAWQALVELGWSFDIVVGVSVGSINGAMVVQDERRLSENLWRELATNNIFDVNKDAQVTDFALEFLKQGGAGAHGLKEFVDTYIDDEKIRKSPVDFGLVTVEFPSLKPHYLWKEDIKKGEIGEYIMASSSAFPAIQAYEIDGKKFVDGGFENNLPIHMAVERGATDIVAIYLNAVGKVDRNKEIASAKNCNLTLVDIKRDMGSFLLFDKANTDRLIRLGYQDTMKAFGVYDGIYYSFIKGEIEKRQIKSADMAAKVFELDPLILYSKDLFIEKLGEAVVKAAKDFQDLIESGQKLLKPGGLDIMKAVDLFVSTNKKVACIMIARDLKAKKEKSIFLSRSAIKLLNDVVLAARFIEKNGMI